MNRLPSVGKESGDSSSGSTVQSPPASIFPKSIIFPKWKLIDAFHYKTGKELLDDLKSNGYRISAWIEDIVDRPTFGINNCKLPIKLSRVKVGALGFSGPAELQHIYGSFMKLGFSCVPPDVALVTRFHYEEQPTREWLRFAVPVGSMTDSDGVAHLPKLGKALGAFFVETYWALPDILFYPHNEFVVVAP